MSRADARRRTCDRHARRHAHPQLEGLEERLLLYSTTGGLWSHPSLITFSFVPDGTNIGGTPSSLFATFNKVAPPQTWQAIFLKAAAIWEQVANINLVQVSDSGVAIGGTNIQQGDSADGDIRIGGLPEDMGTLAFAFLPPAFNGGSDAGDIFFNTSQPWQINTNFDILTVALHEFGHALGMDHSATTSADMYAFYNNIKQVLSPDDVAGIQSIYGARQPDAFVGPNGNYTSATATNLNPFINPNSGQIALYYLDIQGPANPEWFQVTVPSTTTGSMVVTMQSTGLSELSPRIQVYNSSVQNLGYTTAPNAYGSTVTVTITGVTAGQVYYIKAAAASSGPTSGGNYGLLVYFGSNPQYPLWGPNTYVPNALDKGGGVYPERTSDGAGDQGSPIVVGNLTGTGDALTILPGGQHPLGCNCPACRGALMNLLQSSAVVSTNDAKLLIAPSPQAQDVALNALADDPSRTPPRGRAGSQAARLPRIVTLE